MGTCLDERTRGPGLPRTGGHTGGVSRRTGSGPSRRRPRSAAHEPASGADMPSVNQPESPCLPADAAPRPPAGGTPPAPGPGSGPIQISATLAANEVLARKRREGLHVLPMAFGEAGLPAHPAMIRELAAAAGRNAYGPVAGSPELRRAVAGYWSRRSMPTRPEAIVCGPGSKPLLYALMLAIGGDVALPAPSWVTYAAQARLIGGEPELVP